MARPARRRRGGPSYEEVKAQIEERELRKSLGKKPTKKQLEQERKRRIREEQERNRPTEDSANRIRNILRYLTGLEKPDDLMQKIMDALEPSGTVPSPGSFYTFMYSAKTPGIQYDQHPLIYVESLQPWGFIGFNFHWGMHRQYTWQEVITQLYEVDSGELSDMREIPYAKFLNS